MAKTWTPFYFDGNQFFDTIESAEKWDELLRVYRKVHADVQFLRRAKRNPKDRHNGLPAFGFYAEYTESPTLGEWADSEGIDLNI